MAVDPYYWVRDLQAYENQNKAIGRQGLTPDAISGIMRENFAQQQQAEVTQKNIQLAEQGQKFQKEQADIRQGEASKAARQGAYMGGAQLAVNVPLAYAAGKYAGFWGGETAAGTAAETAAETSAGQAAVTGGTSSPVVLPAIGGAGALAGVSYETGRTFEREGIGSETAGRVVGAVQPYYAASLDIASSVKNEIFGGDSGGSIICTELNRQGFIKDSQLRASSLYIANNINNPGNYEFYQGYLIFASPIVSAMKKSRLITLMAYPYGKIICNECASRTSKNYKSTWLSRLVYNMSGRIFKFIYRLKTDSTEVCYGR